jgi:ring-1,2-phenylacetyl-CoA epoxidase subunit PaaD
VVDIDLLPTFSGCPATEMIGEDVETAVREVPGVTEVRVRFRYEPAWSPDRIDDEGREQLRRFGIAPPGGPLMGSARPEGRTSLPLTTSSLGPPRPCPYCGSDDTVRDAPFGPTPCRDVRFCRACDQPFEAFKS